MSKNSCDDGTGTTSRNQRWELAVRVDLIEFTYLSPSRLSSSRAVSTCKVKLLVGNKESCSGSSMSAVKIICRMSVGDRHLGRFRELRFHLPSAARHCDNTSLRMNYTVLLTVFLTFTFKMYPELMIVVCSIV